MTTAPPLRTNVPTRLSSIRHQSVCAVEGAGCKVTVPAISLILLSTAPAATLDVCYFTCRLS